MIALARLLLIPIVLPLVAASCLEDGTPLRSFPERTGGLDLERPLAIGDGFPAGARDGALFRAGQETSVPALFARQAGLLALAQPLVPDPGIATEGESGGRLALVAAFPPVIERLPRGGPPLDPGLERPYDNLGVPGALLAEAAIARSAGTSIGGNPFYDIVLRDRGTFAEQAAERDATFILLWIGTGDVLAYARAGGDPVISPGLPTPVRTFANLYEELLDRLLEIADQVVLFNVPDVTALPFVTAVPPVVLDPLTGEPAMITVIETVVDPETGDTLTVQSQVPVPLVGPGGPLGPDDRVTLEARPLLAEGIGIPEEQRGTGAPLPDRVILDAGEQALARDAVVGYNEAIAAVAAERDLAVVDIAGFVRALGSGGIVSDGILLTDDFVTGQAYSLDGLRFSAKGYGVIANLLIDAVNERYGASLPHLRTAELPGVPLFDAR